MVHTCGMMLLWRPSVRSPNMTAAAEQFTDADSVLRTLIIGLGGFATATALLLAVWNLWTWHKSGDGRSFASLLFGLVLLSFAGLSALTTDHIYRHLLEREAAAWQLYLALGSFVLGAASLISLLSVRFDRSTSAGP